MDALRVATVFVVPDMVTVLVPFVTTEFSPLVSQFPDTVAEPEVNVRVPDVPFVRVTFPAVRAPALTFTVPPATMVSVPDPRFRAPAFGAVIVKVPALDPTVRFRPPVLKEPVVMVIEPLEMEEAPPEAVSAFAPRATVALAFVMYTAPTVIVAVSRVAVNDDGPVSKRIVWEADGMQPHVVPPEFSDQWAVSEKLPAPPIQYTMDAVTVVSQTWLLVSPVNVKMTWPDPSVVPVVYAAASLVTENATLFGFPPIVYVTVALPSVRLSVHLNSFPMEA